MKTQKPKIGDFVKILHDNKSTVRYGMVVKRGYKEQIGVYKILLSDGTWVWRTINSIEILARIK